MLLCAGDVPIFTASNEGKMWVLLGGTGKSELRFYGHHTSGLMPLSFNILILVLGQATMCYKNNSHIFISVLFWGVHVPGLRIKTQVKI